MKKYLIALLFCLISSMSWATMQKLPAGETIFISTPNDGVTITKNLVGMGKTNPAYQLDVNGSSNATIVLQGGSPLASLYWTRVGGGSPYLTPTGAGDDIVMKDNNILYLDTAELQGFGYSSFAGYAGMWGPKDVIFASDSKSGAGTTGYYKMYSGNQTGTGASKGKSGTIQIYSGSSKNDSGTNDSGYIDLNTGAASAGGSGRITIASGAGVNSGPIDIHTGTGSGTNGNIDIYNNGAGGQVSLQHAFTLDYMGNIITDLEFLKNNPRIYMENTNGAYSGNYSQIIDYPDRLNIHAENGSYPDNKYIDFEQSDVLINNSKLYFHDTASLDAPDIEFKSGGILVSANTFQAYNAGGLYGVAVDNGWTGFWGDVGNEGNSEISIGADGIINLLTEAAGSAVNAADIVITAGNGLGGSGGNGGDVNLTYGLGDGAGNSGAFSVNPSSGSGGWMYTDGAAPAYFGFGVADSVDTAKQFVFEFGGNSGVLDIYTENNSSYGYPRSASDINIFTGLGQDAGNGGNISLIAGTSTDGANYAAQFCSDNSTITGNSVNVEDGRTIMFTTDGTLPAELTTADVYYMVNSVTIDAVFQVSTSNAGPVVLFTDVGTGTIWQYHLVGATPGNIYLASSGNITLDAPSIIVTGPIVGTANNALTANYASLAGTADIALTSNVTLAIPAEISPSTINVTVISFGAVPDTIAEVLVSADRQVTVNIGGDVMLLYGKHI